MRPGHGPVGRHYDNPNYAANISWSNPATNRLLFEAGALAKINTINSKRQPEVGPNDIAVTELATNRVYNSRALNLGVAGGYSGSVTKRYIQRFAVSYVIRAGSVDHPEAHAQPGAA